MGYTTHMAELIRETPLVRRYENATHLAWKVEKPAGQAELTDFLSRYNLAPAEPLMVMRGGGIFAPVSNDIAPGYKRYLTNERPFAVLPVKSDPNGRLEQVVHFPTRIESLRPDANLATYKQFVGDYVAAHWGHDSGVLPPLAKTVIDTLPDGRFVTMDKYRPYLRGLGKGSGALGIHEFDTKRFDLTQTPALLATLQAVHPDAASFAAWVKERDGVLPRESTLHPENPQHALRGQEWWVNPTADSDRLRELTDKAKGLGKQFAALDSSFDAPKALEDMIKNNLAIFPHVDGSGTPAQKDGLVVVHGTIYPDNIQQSTNREGTKSFYTITGGDRSHVGLPGEMIDWLVSASAESPAHQEALIAEFLKRFPSDKDKRGLAMHILYRNLMELPWFASQEKTAEVANLTKLSYDIMKGNGIWQGVNTPVGV
jgi:hypothetical protein